MGPQKVRAALHPEHNSRGRGRLEAEKRESYARYRANKKEGGRSLILLTINCERV